MVQKFKNLNIKTATLSHGIFLAERDINKIDYCGLELKATNSDFFLAWNNFTYSEAIKQGIKPEKIKVLGIPQFVKTNKINCNKDKKTFGIILENKSGEEYNKKLIYCANKLSYILNFKFSVRYHPSFSGDEYDNLIDKKNFIGKNKDVEISNYCKKVNFSLIANSSVFIELIFLKHKIYRFSSDNIYDKYRDFNFNSFKNFDELNNLIKNKIDQSSELFEQLCTVNNVKSSYLNFFKQFD
jgi:hypothetical protein